MLFLSFVIVFLSIIVLQGIYLKRYAIRLPEAKGNRFKINSSSISLLHIGESTVAGVGVMDISDGLTINVVNNLSDELKQEIDWEVLGKNGAKVIDSLSFKSRIKKPDILIVSFGVNDTTNFTNISKLRQSIKESVHSFSSKSTCVFFTSIPKLHKFPLLPPPLSWVLGIKAYFVDKEIQRLCSKNRWVYIKSEMSPAPSLMSKDGYHPNSSGYKVWAKLISSSILNTIKNKNSITRFSR